MPKEDYLMKYLEKLGSVIAAMLGLRLKGAVGEAIRVSDETFGELLSLSLDDILKLSDEEFESVVEKENFTATLLEPLASMAFQTYLCYDQLGDMQARKAFGRKALILYRLLNKKDKTFSFEREAIIEELENS